MKPIYVTSTSNGWRLQFEYNPMLVDVVKRIPNRRWMQDEQAWFIPNTSANMPEGRTPQWYINSICLWAIQKRLVKSRIDKAIEGDGDYTLPEMPKLEEDPGMLVSLREYQKEGVAYAMAHKRVIFGDQPGLGKTCQAITSAKMLNAFPVLVICPNSLKVNWKREFKKFAGIESIILDNSNINTWPIFWETKTHGGDRLAKVFIVNYESVKKFFVHKMDPKARPSIVLNKEVDLFKCVIIDESHRCKSAKTQQSKIIERICKGKDYVFALTGTPFVNSNVDYIQQLKILGRLEDFGGYNKFSRVYCSGPKMTSNSKQLNYMLRKTCFFRRLKKDVLTELPAKSRQYITCEITNKPEYKQAESNLIDWLREFKKADDESISRTMRGEVMTKIGILKQISARGKLAEFISFCHDMTDGGEKLIVFGFLKDVIYAIHREFRDCSVVITGDNTIEEKQQAVDRFQNDPDVRIIILNYRSGGVGLTLTAASRVAFIEFPWTYADCEQAEDRAHRIGQTDSVDCYYFLGNGTIDNYLYETIQRKKSGANESTGTDEQTEENMVNLCLGFFSDKIK